MRRIARTSFVVAAAAIAGLSGVGVASATPPVPHPEPGGIIRMDVAPGEWWKCTGMSLQPPFYQTVPGVYQFVLGPAPIYLHFTPGADVWVWCAGSGAPFEWVGPVVKAGA